MGACTYCGDPGPFDTVEELEQHAWHEVCRLLRDARIITTEELKAPFFNSFGDTPGRLIIRAIFTWGDLHKQLEKE